MPTAFAWARVSSREQEEARNSIDEQLRRIEVFAASQDVTVTRKFSAGESAFRGDRTEFNAFLAEAVRDRPDYIIADDSSRISRSREDAIRAKKVLRDAGIRILFVNEPNLDPDTMAGYWFGGFRELTNEGYSRELAFNTVRGMQANIAARDPASGWCYKNGGRVPYGYKRLVLDFGTNAKAKPIRKVIWELDPERAPIVHRVIVDLFTAKRMSYNRIRDHLNQEGIPSPSGGPWGLSTIVELLRDNRLEQYAGYGFWNKESRGRNGKRFNDRDKWITVEKAHPAIISPPELDAALSRRASGRTQCRYARAKDSPYLFTGTNYEGRPMFVCSSCTGNVIGYRNGTTAWRKYVCGVARNKGVAGCPDHLIVDVKVLETKILDQIRARYVAPDARSQVVRAILDKLAQAPTEYKRALTDLERRRTVLALQRQRLLDSIKQGIPAELIKDDAIRLADEIAATDRDIRALKEAPPTPLQVTAQEVEGFLANFDAVFEAGTPEERRRLVRTFVHRLELDPKKQEVRVEFYADPQLHTIGVRRGT